MHRSASRALCLVVIYWDEHSTVQAKSSHMLGLGATSILKRFEMGFSVNVSGVHYIS
jgi:hypothetical protein